MLLIFIYYISIEQKKTTLAHLELCFGSYNMIEKNYIYGYRYIEWLYIEDYTVGDKFAKKFSYKYFVVSSVQS